jgi:hypothetical protein
VVTVGGTVTFKRLGLIEAGWLSYAGEIIPKNAPPVQIQESRRVFYAGAGHMFSVLGALGENQFSEDQGVAVMERILAELQQFGRDVGTDRERGRR